MTEDKWTLDTKWEVARDILAHYSGALGNVIMRLEDKPDAKPDEIDAYRKELKKVNHELHTMQPEDPDLVNKALYIYGPMVRYLMEKYL